mgnify:CR=1 FL=1
MQIGTITSSEARSMEVRGKCLVEGLPKAVIVTSKEMKEALEEPVTAIAGAVCSVLEKTPPAEPAAPVSALDGETFRLPQEEFSTLLQTASTVTIAENALRIKM